MRVFFLCVDGLEYDFVKDRPYPNLKQKQFLRVGIPREGMTITKDGRIAPHTPVIWKIIFTGKIEALKPQQKPQTLQWNNKFLNWLKSRNSAGRLYHFFLHTGILKPGFPQRLGFTRKDISLDEDTIISQASKPLIVRHPLKTDVKWAVKGMRSGFSLTEVMQSHLEVFEREKKDTFDQIDQDWNLFVVYTKLLDAAGHLYWQRDEIVHEFYAKVEDFAREIRRALPGDVFIAIASDHGMRPLRGTKYQGGEHSHHAYASFSHEIQLDTPIQITDIRPVITQMLNREPDCSGKMASNSWG